MFQYSIPTEPLRDLAHEQVWEMRYGDDVYNALSAHEFRQIAQHIGQPHVVLDFACGLGRASIYLHHLLGDASVRYILADRTGRTKNTGEFDPAQDEFYNDLDLAVQFCRINGLENTQPFDTERDDWAQLPQVDLVISTLGLGFHVPIERYLDRLLAVASKDCKMIFGVRCGQYDAGSFADRFDSVELLAGIDQWPFPHEDWLVLRT